MSLRVEQKIPLLSFTMLVLAANLEANVVSAYHLSRSPFPAD